jgi:hypothetical protein
MTTKCVAAAVATFLPLFFPLLASADPCPSLAGRYIGREDGSEETIAQSVQGGKPVYVLSGGTPFSVQIFRVGVPDKNNSGSLLASCSENKLVVDVTGAQTIDPATNHAYTYPEDSVNSHDIQAFVQGAVSRNQAFKYSTVARYELFRAPGSSDLTYAGTQSTVFTNIATSETKTFKAQESASLKARQ